MSDPKQQMERGQQKHVEIDDLEVHQGTLKDLTEEQADQVQGWTPGYWEPKARMAIPVRTAGLKTVLLCAHTTAVPAGCPSTVVKT